MVLLGSPSQNCSVCFGSEASGIRTPETLNMLKASKHIFVSEANLQDPPVRQSPFLKNLVTTTPPKRLDGLS